MNILGLLNSQSLYAGSGNRIDPWMHQDPSLGAHGICRTIQITPQMRARDDAERAARKPRGLVVESWRASVRRMPRTTVEAKVPEVVQVTGEPVVTRKTPGPKPTVVARLCKCGAELSRETRGDLCKMCVRAKKTRDAEDKRKCPACGAARGRGPKGKVCWACWEAGKPEREANRKATTRDMKREISRLGHLAYKKTSTLLRAKDDIELGCDRQWAELNAGTKAWLLEKLGDNNTLPKENL